MSHPIAPTRRSFPSRQRANAPEKRAFVDVDPMPRGTKRVNVVSSTADVPFQIPSLVAKEQRLGVAEEIVMFHLLVAAEYIDARVFAPPYSALMHEWIDGFFDAADGNILVHADEAALLTQCQEGASVWIVLACVPLPRKCLPACNATIVCFVVQHPLVHRVRYTV